MKSAAAVSRKAVKPAEDLDDFEAGPSDEEELSGSGSDSGGSSGSYDQEQPASEEVEEDGGFDSCEDSDAGLDEPVSSGDDEEGGEADEAADSDAGGSDGEGGGGQQQPGGFLEGGKAASFAKAFAKIVEGSGKKAAAAGAPAQQTAAAAVPAPAEAPILAASKSIAKRKAEDQEEAKADREAKKLRQEMKQRGHEIPKRRGQDPAHDAHEKGLQRLATKGVVRLFNAIAKAQKQLRDTEEATGSRAKAVKLGKASFLAQLKASGSLAAGGAAPGESLVPSVPARQAAAAAAAPAGRQQRQRQQAAAAAESSEEEEAGWDVLKQGFVGLQGGSKMKDWDKQESDEEGPGDGVQMGGSSDED